MSNIISQRDPIDPDSEILAHEVIRSFSSNPSTSVRIVCFNSGQDVHDFYFKMEAAQKAGKISPDIKIITVVFSGGTPKEKIIEWGIEEIEKSKSIIISATDFYHDFSREVLSRIPKSKILFFGYQEDVE